MSLKTELSKLRTISYGWDNLDEVYLTLKDIKQFFRTEVIMTSELFDLYDEIVMSIINIENSVEIVLFDETIFKDALTRFGFEDLGE